MNLTLDKKLPVGIENFQEITSGRYYFVDKTAFIRDIALNHDKVNLITRPRRFGKTLNMNMLKTFFDINGDKNAFAGLEIANDQDFCNTYMGKYPVISISLKSVEGLSFESAIQSLKWVIAEEAERIYRYLKKGTVQNENIEVVIGQIMQKNQYGSYTMAVDVLERSLKDLTYVQYELSGVKPILLIDEYDVPLDKANQHGYYDEMIDLLRKLLGNVLKTNDYLEFAVLTGCLRISKESIFTGLNNFSVFPVSEPTFSDYFGFTDGEVKELLAYYNLTDLYPLLKQWYDGYRFGDREIYCPWDIIKYCSDLLRLKQRDINASLEPKNYWINTSENTIIKELIAQADEQTKEDIEKLIAGESLSKEINEALTYNDLYKNETGIWSLMLASGYLTFDSYSGAVYVLRIPNNEIRSIFTSQVIKWFNEKIANEPERIEKLCFALENGDARGFEKSFSDYLLDTISIRDTSVQRARKENFYHGLLHVLFSHQRNWIIKSNHEAGDGYSDIIIKNRRKDLGIIIELKYADNYNMLEIACNNALSQIEDKHYDLAFVDERIKTIYKYGVACCRKTCKVVVR